MDYTGHFSTKQTSQTEPIPGKQMVQNNASGYVYKISKWEYLDRFLILGTEGNTYYQSEKTMTIKNAKNVIECIKEDGLRVIKTTVDISASGRAPKNNQAIFVIALCCTFGDQQTKNQAYKAIKEVCRIGTHIFQFCENIQKLRGWSRGLRHGVEDYFYRDNIAYDMIKYRQRDGWTHRDVIRLSHPRPKDKIHSNLLKWAIGREVDQELPEIIQSFERMQKAESVKAVLNILKESKLPWETIPTKFLKDKKIWEALLPNLPMTALTRNLGRMSSLGMFKSNLQDETKLAVERLANPEAIKKSRIHPITALNAMKVYESGHGVKGSLSWDVCGKIKDALEEMFYLSFGNVEPTGLNWMLSLDVSGSMTCGTIAGTQITPHEATAALAMITARTEKNYEINGFSNTLQKLDITAKDTLSSAIKKTYRSNFSGTDASIPVSVAYTYNIPVDVFTIYTDNETWAGHIHTTQALEAYRKKMNRPNAKLIAVGMTATKFSVVDPDDPNQMNVVGFDTGSLEAMRYFSLKEMK